MLNKPTILSSSVIIGLFVSFSINASANDSLTKQDGAQVAQVFQKGKKRAPRFPGKEAGTLKTNKEGLDPRISELESQLVAATEAQQNLNDKIVELEKQLKILNDRNIELESQLAEANDARQSFVDGISQLESQLAEATDAQQPLNVRIAELEGQLAEATDAQQRLNVRLTQCSRLAETTTAQQPCQENVSQNGSIAECQRDLLACQSTINRRNAQSGANSQRRTSAVEDAINQQRRREATREERTIRRVYGNPTECQRNLISCFDSIPRSPGSQNLIELGAIGCLRDFNRCATDAGEPIIDDEGQEGRSAALIGIYLQNLRDDHRQQQPDRSDDACVRAGGRDFGRCDCPEGMIRQGGPCIPEPVPSAEDIEERNRREHLRESRGICITERNRLCGCVRNNERGFTRCELRGQECRDFLAQQDPPYSVDECITEKMNEAGYQYETRN